MTSKNSISLIGNLVKDPDLQTTKQGLMVCNVRLAMNREFRQPDGEKKRSTTYVDVAIWGAPGEVFARHHRKGDLASVDGYLKNDEWVDKATGSPRSALKVVAEEWYFVGRRSAALAGEPPPDELPASNEPVDDTPF